MHVKEHSVLSSGPFQINSILNNKIKLHMKISISLPKNPHLPRRLRWQKEKHHLQQFQDQ